MSSRYFNPNDLPSVKTFIRQHGRKPNWLVRQEQEDLRTRNQRYVQKPLIVSHEKNYRGPEMTREELANEILREGSIN